MRYNVFFCCPSESHLHTYRNELGQFVTAEFAELSDAIAFCDSECKGGVEYCDNDDSHNNHFWLEVYDGMPFYEDEGGEMQLKDALFETKKYYYY